MTAGDRTIGQQLSRGLKPVVAIKMWEFTQRRRILALAMLAKFFGIDDDFNVA